jgi:hypothetical protein
MQFSVRDILSQADILCVFQSACDNYTLVRTVSALSVEINAQIVTTASHLYRPFVSYNRRACVWNGKWSGLTDARREVYRPRGGINEGIASGVHVALQAQAVTVLLVHISCRWRLGFLPVSQSLHFVIRNLSRIKPRRMRWSDHVARMGEKRNTQVIGGKARGKETTRKTKT